MLLGAPLHQPVWEQKRSSDSSLTPDLGMMYSSASLFGSDKNDDDSERGRGGQPSTSSEGEGERGEVTSLRKTVPSEAVVERGGEKGVGKTSEAPAAQPPIDSAGVEGGEREPSPLVPSSEEAEVPVGGEGEPMVGMVTPLSASLPEEDDGVVLLYPDDTAGAALARLPFASPSSQMEKEGTIKEVASAL